MQKETIDEFWHMDGEGEGAAGPFYSVDEAKTDALKFTDSTAYHYLTIKIMKVVAQSSTRVSFDTTWKDFW